MDYDQSLDNETTCEYDNRRTTTSLKLTFSVIYTLVFIVGVTGNCLVIYVIARFKEMHVVTNIYLLSQAIADFLYLWQIPFLVVTIMLSRWIFGYILCKFYMLLAGVIWFAGLFTLTAVSADRYVAVVHFRTQSKYRTKLLAIWVVIALWILSLIVMTPINIYSTVTVGKKKISLCRNAWPDWKSQKYFTIYTFCLGYFIPVILIVIFYSLVIRTLRTSGPENKNKSKQQKVTTLVLAVVLTYIFLWLPYWANQVYMVSLSIDYILPFGNQTNLTDVFTEAPPIQPNRHNVTSPTCSSQRNQRGVKMWIVTFLFQTLSYINSAINPILYAFMSQNFRACFKTVFRCGRGRRMHSMFENSTAVTTARTRMTVSTNAAPPTYETLGTFQEVNPVSCDENDKFVILHLTQGNGVETPEILLEKTGVQETDID